MWHRVPSQKNRDYNADAEMRSEGPRAISRVYSRKQEYTRSRESLVQARAPVISSFDRRDQ